MMAAPEAVADIVPVQWLRFDRMTLPELAPVITDRFISGEALCPWCDGRGARLRDRDVRVPCAPCAETGLHEAWQGVAADEWRVRRHQPAWGHAPLINAAIIPVESEPA